MPVFFPDHPEFTPDYSPYTMFSMGIFMDHCTNCICGYFRPICLRVLMKEIKDDYKRYDWGDLPIDKLLTNKPDITKNKYSVGAGQSLRTWECKGWIDPEHPRGFIDWYCSFYAGNRIPEIDSKQIKRWISMKNRFSGMKKTNVVKQTLLNWAIKVE